MSKKQPKSPQLKFQLAIEAIKGKISQTELSRQYSSDPKLVSRWKNEVLERGYQLFENKKDNSQKQIEQLEQVVGKKEIEIQLLKKFLSHYNST
jgi:transposase